MPLGKAEGDSVSDSIFETIKRELDTNPSSSGLAPSDVVGFSEPLRGALSQAMRAGTVTLTELAEMLQLPREQALEIARSLKAKGFLQQRFDLNDSEITYDVRMSARTRKLEDRLPKNLWDKLDEL